MFIDRIMVTGFAIAVVTTVLAAVGLTIAVIYLLNLPVPQVVRLVALVPSPGSVVLDDVGDSATLSVQGYYSDQTMAELEADFITYESTDPSVVSVSPDGVVTATGAGGADIVIGFGRFSRMVHALVFGDIPTLPPIDPAMVGVIPGLDEEVRAVLNRIIVELRPGHDMGDAEDIAEAIGGEVVFSFSMFPGHVIEFDTERYALLEILANLEADRRIATAYPDILSESSENPIDTLLLPHVTNQFDLRQCIDPTDPGGRIAINPNTQHFQPGFAYLQPGFKRAWRIMERVPFPALNPVVISVIEAEIENVTNWDQHQVVGWEFDADRINTPMPATTIDDHMAAVMSIIVARNLQREGSAENESNFSGIVTSVEGLQYDIIAFDTDALSDQIHALQLLRGREPFGHGVDVVNMSYGSPYGFLQRLPVFKSHEARDIIEDMTEAVFVTSAGNERIDAKDSWPAALTMEQKYNMITVGGANCGYEDRHRNSNFGDAITLTAPGEQVLAVDISYDPGYSFMNGTSFAAPMVSGTVALLRAIDPDSTPEELNELLVEAADEMEICTIPRTPAGECSEPGEVEEWSFLRADKAVAQLLFDRVDARIQVHGWDELTITVPTESQRVVGNRFDFGVYVVNTGEIAWPFYGEAVVRSPTGVESKARPVEIVVEPGERHQFRWGFWPPENGCWDVKFNVWMEDPNGESTYLIDSIGELRAMRLLDATEVSVPGQLADSGWRNDILEVRSDPNQPEQCSDADRTIPFTNGQTGAKANVLLLADTSGSMEGPKTDALKEAIGIFVETMSNIRLEAKGGIDPDPDYVGLTDFDGDYREVVSIGPIDPGGADIDAWEDAASSLDADGGTALYDAIIRSVDALEERGDLSRKNILIALTDGVDQNSVNSLGDALSTLDQSSVTLFAVALSEPGGGGDYDFSVLEELANSRGGAAYAADTRNLPGLYEFFTAMFRIEP